MSEQLQTQKQTRRSHRGKRNLETKKTYLTMKEVTRIEWRYVYETSYHDPERMEDVCLKTPEQIKAFLEIICNGRIINQSNIVGRDGLVIIDSKTYEIWQEMTLLPRMGVECYQSN